MIIRVLNEYGGRAEFRKQFFNTVVGNIAKYKKQLMDLTNI